MIIQQKIFNILKCFINWKYYSQSKDKKKQLFILTVYTSNFVSINFLPLFKFINIISVLLDKINYLQNLKTIISSRTIIYFKLSYIQYQYFFYILFKGNLLFLLFLFYFIIYIKKKFFIYFLLLFLLFLFYSSFILFFRLSWNG